MRTRTSNIADICTKVLSLSNYLSFTLPTALCPETAVGEGIKITSVIIMISQTHQPDSLKTLHLNNGNRQKKSHNQKVYFSPINLINLFTTHKEKEFENNFENNTWSNNSNSLALGWWIVQMMDRPPWAKAFIRETTWKHDALSKPLNERKEVCYPWVRTYRLELAHVFNTSVSYYYLFINSLCSSFILSYANVMLVFLHQSFN